MEAEVTIQNINRKAEEFERRWRTYLRHTHEQFLMRIFTAPGEHLLDASAGTGLLAEELISSQYPFARLVLNDPADEMLSIARDRLRDETRLSFTHHLAHKLPFDGYTFDRIFCLNSFHYYHEQDRVLDRFFDILKPGGRCYLLDWNRSGFFRVVNRIIKWSVPERIDTQSLNEISHLAEQSGFTVDSGESWNWRYWKFLFLELKK